MSVMNKPDYKIFAQDAKSGEYVAFPDILRGWGITLEQYNGFPPMELFNSAAKRIDEWLMYLTQRGLPEWDAVVDYPKDAMIQHAGVYYVSLKATKGEQPNNSQASWKKLTEVLGVDGKLTKDQNGADIPNKDTFIKNLGLGDAAKSNVVQATGDSITDVMSQRTVTFHLSNKATKDDLLTKMDIGYLGWGGKGEAYSPAYVDYVNDLKNADTPTKVMRSDSVTSNAHFKYGTVAYFKSRETFMAVTAAYDGEGVRVLAGNPNTLSIYNLADTKNVIGIGQTWQNMTVSRAIGTTYTNATTKPIMISVTKLGRAATTLYINNQVVSSVDYGDGNLQGSLSTIIPAGSTYKIEVYSGTIQGWWELR